MVYRIIAVVGEGGARPNLAKMENLKDKPFAILRIIFGGVWLIEASFKWNPVFLNNFTSYLTSGAQGQSALVQAWVNLWIQGVSVNPHLFGIIVAIAETCLGVSLIFGLFTEFAIVGGTALSLVIWSTAEGFGGPYAAGSTDIGAAIIYVLVFVALWFGRCWRSFGLDSLIRKKMPSLYWRW